MTAEAKQRAHEQRQVSRVVGHVYGQHVAKSPDHIAGVVAQPLKEIVVNDLRFRVATDGSKLIRMFGMFRLGSNPDRRLKIADGPRADAQATPKQTKVAGVTFLRSKNGNLYRAGLVKQQRSEIVAW